MKKPFLKEIKNNIKELMKENHFVSNGQSYIRITNKQVIQIIHFTGYSSGDKFSIEIGVFPICSCVFNILPTPRIHIGQLKKTEYWGLEYNEESINKTKTIIEKYILPLLDNYSDYKKIYEELNQLVNDIPREKRNWDDPKTVIYYNISEEFMFWVCLRNGNYNKCKIILNNLKRSNEEWLKHSINSSEENINNTEIKKYKEIFVGYKKDFIEMADNKLKLLEKYEKLLDNNEVDKLMEISNEYENKNLKSFQNYL